jgi:hypothetical protein
MSTTVSPGREKSHTPASPVLDAPSPLPAPAVDSAARPYWGDRLALIFWLACAGLLVALQVGQHLVYLLR